MNQVTDSWFQIISHKSESNDNIVAVVELGKETSLALVQKGEILISKKLDVIQGEPLKGHLARAVHSLGTLCKNHGIKLINCVGLCILVEGIVDNRNMIPLSKLEYFEEIQDFNFKEWVQVNTGLQLRMENITRSELLGEWNYGVGKGCENILQFTIGNRIATSVIMNGEVLVGRNFSQGLLGGHVIVKQNGRRCNAPCNSYGCLESEASERVLAQLVKEHELYKESSLRNESVIGFPELRAHVEKGDGCAKQIFDHCIEYWALGLVSLTHLFEPELIIMGGKLVHDDDTILQSIRKVFDQRVWEERRGIKINKSSVPDAGSLKGASFIFEN
jgi:glucokinase